MSNKIKILVATIFFILFQNIEVVSDDTRYDSYSCDQLESYFGKPVFNYRLITIDQYGSTISENWMYTTELSRILLVTDSSFIINYQFPSRWYHYFFQIGGYGFLASKSIVNLIHDTRFGSFIENVGKYSQEELQEAIKDAILLSPLNNRSYSAHKLLSCLIKILENKIDHINYQIAYDSNYDKESIDSLKKSISFAALLIALVAYNEKKNTCSSVDNNVFNKDKKEKNIKDYLPVGLRDSYHLLTIELPKLLYVPVSCKALYDCYNVFTIDCKAYIKDLDELQDLLIFVKKLHAELQANGKLSFKLARGYVGTLNVHQSYLGQYEKVVFSK